MRPNSTLDKKYTTAEGGKYKPHARMPRAKRQEMLDKVLLRLLRTRGLHGVTKSAFAAEAGGVSTGLLHTYYGDIKAVHKAAVMLAVTAGDKATVLTALDHGFALRDLPWLVRATVKGWRDGA